MKKICIFDLDGTLTDTSASLLYSVNETLKEMHLGLISAEQCQSYVGNGARRLIELSLRSAGDPEALRLEEGMQIYRRIFDANCTYQVHPYDGIPEVLDTLSSQKVSLAVLSNKPHAQTVKVVNTVFGKERFTAICGQRDMIPRKPDPAGIFEILKETGYQKEDCLYIGDSEVDIRTGENAGVDTISVSWGFRSVSQLEAADARIIISHPGKLPEFL